MRQTALRVCAIAACLFVAGALNAQDREPLSTPMSEARITVSNRADADGYVMIRLTPVGGDPVQATVDVLDRMSENDIAADIEKELTIALGSAYEVERRGGENVRIEKADRDTGADFVLEIAFNTPGLSITMHN